MQQFTTGLMERLTMRRSNLPETPCLTIKCPFSFGEVNFLLHCIHYCNILWCSTTAQIHVKTAFLWTSTNKQHQSFLSRILHLCNGYDVSMPILRFFFCTTST